MEKDAVWLFVAHAIWISVPWCIAIVAMTIHMHYRR